MNTKQYLNRLFSDFATVAKLPTTAEQAENENKSAYLAMEFSSNYGGYRLTMVNVSNGGHGGVMGESSACARRSLKEMTAYLEGLVTGINYALDQNGRK